MFPWIIFLGLPLPLLVIGDESTDCVAGDDDCTGCAALDDERPDLDDACAALDDERPDLDDERIDCAADCAADCADPLDESPI